MCCSDWKQLFDRATVRHLEYWHSDHRPLLVDIVSQGDIAVRGDIRKKGHFHFEACWVDKEDCKIVVIEGWGN